MTVSVLQICPHDDPPFADLCHVYRLAVESLGCTCTTVILGRASGDAVQDAIYLGQPDLSKDRQVVQALHAALRQGSVRWLATAAMRGELERVLGYPRVLPRLAPPGPSAHDVLAAFDRWATVVAPAAPAPVRCRDPDDQPFIDLAVAHGALLLSKDAQVLGTARRVALLGARVARHWPPA